MNTIRVIGRVDHDAHLVADVPGVPPGPVQVLIILRPTHPDPAEAAWMDGIAQEWAAELGDAREDIYTLADGEPVNGSR